MFESVGILLGGSQVALALKHHSQYHQIMKTVFKLIEPESAMIDNMECMNLGRSMFIMAKDFNATYLPVDAKLADDGFISEDQNQLRAIVGESEPKESYGSSHSAEHSLKCAAAIKNITENRKRKLTFLITGKTIRRLRVLALGRMTSNRTMFIDEAMRCKSTRVNQLANHTFVCPRLALLCREHS